jgi:drug/metabolite transporter (DMT)-like permease
MWLISNSHFTFYFHTQWKFMLSQRKAELILVLATFIASAGWIFSKQAIQGLPVFGFIGIRFVLASLCLLPLCYGALIKTKPKDIVKALGVGLILGCSILLWIYAISVSPTLGEGAFIMSLSMLLVPLIAWPLFKRKPPGIFWFSLPFAMIGLFLLSLQGEWKESSSQIWFALSSLLLAFHFNFNGKYSQRIPPLLLTCLQLFVVGILGLIVSLLFETRPSSVDTSIWIWVALSILLATSLRYVLQTICQKNCSPSIASIIMILEPLWVVVLSVILYGEAMPVSKIAGGALILLSLLIFRVGGKILNKRVALKL